MNVNTPSRVNLRTVADRVRAVFTTLKLAPGDMALRRQVGTFITCNGYQSVLRAAQLTAKQAEREDIADPWAYTIAVYNGNLARLSHLYTLTHWVENGLRSQFDLHYGATLGATWHRFPDQYLPRDSPANFLSLHASMGVESRDVPWSDRGRPRKEIPRPADAALFVREFVWHVPVLCQYRRLREPPVSELRTARAFMSSGSTPCSAISERFSLAGNGDRDGSAQSAVPQPTQVVFFSLLLAPHFAHLTASLMVSSIFGCT